MSNDQSHLGTNAEGSVVSFVGPDAVSLYRARLLASSIRLWIKSKIIPTRGVTITVMLRHATGITGKPYKRGEAQRAADDVTAWANAMVSALPVIGPGGPAR